MQKVAFEPLGDKYQLSNQNLYFFLHLQSCCIVIEVYQNQLVTYDLGLTYDMAACAKLATGKGKLNKNNWMWDFTRTKSNCCKNFIFKFGKFWYHPRGPSASRQTNKHKYNEKHLVHRLENEEISLLRRQFLCA